MKDQKRKFKGVWIPAETWLDESLSLIEKALLAEIDSLDNENGCFAGNAYFAKFFGLKIRMIGNHIKSLKEKEKISLQMIGRNKRVLRVINCHHDSNKLPSDDSNKLQHNNTGINNPINISDSSESQGSSINELIDLFRIVNPSWQRLFANKNQRMAVDRLQKQWKERLPKIIQFLPHYNSAPYNGTAIITPIELENKMGKLIAFAEQHKAKANSKGKEIIGL